MRALKNAGLAALAALTITACSKDDKSETLNPAPLPVAPAVVDVQDADALTNTIRIEDATLMQGTPGQVQADKQSQPKVGTSPRLIFARQGEMFMVNFHFTAAQATQATYAGCHLQVVGASSYFDIPAKGQSGFVQIPIELPAKLQGESFQIKVIGYDADDNYSQPRHCSVIVNEVGQQQPKIVAGPQPASIPVDKDRAIKMPR